MTGAEGMELRSDDRITVVAGIAKSGHTFTPLARGCSVEVLHVRRDHNGDYEVEGALLTARGAWRKGLPVRSFLLSRGSYSTPIRVGDTVRYPETGETPVVTAIHVRPDGVALADLLFSGGATTSGTPLVDLEHLARPGVEPTVQSCKRRHAGGVACNRCAEATEPVTTGCDASMCSRAAVALIVWSPESGGQLCKAYCEPDADRVVAMLAGRTVVRIPLADGSISYLADGGGTQVATCYHCGHAIYLYPALRGRRWPWRDGLYDETGRCALGEDRQRVPVRHEPAVTVAERDYARAAATCSTSGDLHPLADCPAHRSGR